MSESLFSQSWYRVAKLKPRMRVHAQIHRHRYRGLDWYVLQDHSTGRFHRFTPEAYQIIGMMDGKRTLDQIWTNACARLGDDMPSQDEVISLLSQLYKIDVIQSDAAPNIEDLEARGKQQKQNLLVTNLKSPLALRLPLLDPDQYLDLALPLIRPLYSWVGALIWFVFVAPAVVLAAVHWSELSMNVTDQMFTLENLVLLWAIYPVIKILHELGHAYAVKAWGGEVHEMGCMFLVFMPVPYVDASASSAFREKHRRMIVGAAGILVEMFLAALALYVWLNIQPGKMRAVSYNVMLIAGVSTLLFNGNPLLRFDAYYVLADYLEIPNLGSRGTRYLGFLAQKYLMGLPDLDSPASTPGEAVWLAVYASAASVYRLFIMVAIVSFVASKFFVFGMVLGVWSLASLFLAPTFRAFQFIVNNPGMRRQRARLIFIIVVGLVLPLYGFFMVPLPSLTMAEGIIAPPDQARVYSSSAGFVEEILVESGAQVVKGQPLLRCSNAELESHLDVLEAQLREYDVRRRVSRQESLLETSILDDQCEQVEAEIARAKERKSGLLIRSPAKGIFLFPRASDFPGHFLRQGTPIGHVVNFDRVTILMVLRQAEVERVRFGTRKIEARLAETIRESFPCTLLRMTPAATKDLPSLALSLEGGGSIALDPTKQEKPQAYESLFQVELAMKAIKVDKIGGRVHVRFEHEPETLWTWSARSLRRLLLQKFDV